MKPLKMFVWVIIIVAAVFVGLSGFLYLNQRRIVFVPMRDYAATPDHAHLDYEKIWLEPEAGVRIRGWYFPARENGSKTVMLCHGNAGNISHRLESAHFLLELGVNVLLFDYRGYGESNGTPSEEGVYADAEAAYRWLRDEKHVDSTDIIIFGRSLGGAVAIELARREPCGGLIVESSFTSAADFGRKMFPFLPIRLLIKYHFDSVNKIGELSCPVLVTHSPEDDLVPYQMGERLFAAAKAPKKFIALRGSHNERMYFSDQQYIDGVRGFIFDGGVN